MALNLIIICLFSGAVGALLQGMVGVGTGIVIIPLLTFLLPHYGFTPGVAIHIALATSMAAIVMNSISALISHYRRGNVQFNLFKKIIGFSLVGACVGALIASAIAGRYLEIIFGTFMILTAIYMVAKKHATDDVEIVPSISWTKLGLGGFIIGLVASLIGTGGGILMVPFMHSLKVKMRYAVGTSTLIGLPIAIVGAVTYILTGLAPMSETPGMLGYLHWQAFIAFSVAGMIAAPYGAKLATIVPTKILQQLFAVCMIIIGFKMLF